MLMSSSSLLQWIPCPRPINRQLFRSAAVAWSSLGNQASGTERLRPSLNSTVSVSSVTMTVSAAGTAISTAEVFIPRLPQIVLMRAQEFLNPIQLRTGKTAAFLQTDRIKPKLRQPFPLVRHAHEAVHSNHPRKKRTGMDLPSELCRHGPDIVEIGLILARQLYQAEASCIYLPREQRTDLDLASLSELIMLWEHYNIGPSNSPILS